MADAKDIYNFATKWCEKFRDQNIDYIALVDHYMADDCEKLGFIMDCGQAFAERYGTAAHNHEELNRIIDDVADIDLLGSAIYSRWRYFNHWAYSGEEILAPGNRSWFIIALGRLALLTGENPFIFTGKLRKIKIVSNGLCYGPCPESDDEVEQHLTITLDGRVWFSSYVFGDGYGKYKRQRSEIFSISKKVTEKIFDAFESYFSNEYEEVFATDIGSWEMELTNEEGKCYKFRGSLCADFELDDVDLSDLIRDSLNMQDLYVFDGNNKPDTIEKIVIDYNRVTKIKPGAVVEKISGEYMIWDYSEQLIIDRESETIEYIQNIGSACKASHKYEVEGGVESLLDNFDADYFLQNVENEPDDIVYNPLETTEYTITIDFKKNPQRIIRGHYDKYGLPEDFPEFAEAVAEFIRFYHFAEILNPKVYGKSNRRKGELIFCSVVFGDGYKSYYYLTDDDGISVGDYVVVPAGVDNHNAIVRVVKIEYFSEDRAPMPINKIKRIIRKSSYDEYMECDDE